MCHGLESILFRTSESAACPPGRVKYIPCYASSQPAKEVFVILFFVVVIFQLEKGRCAQESSPSHAYLFQTSSQNNIVPVACDLIGSGYLKCIQKCYRAATCRTENANANHLAGCRRGKKIKQIEVDPIKKKCEV